MAESGRQKVKTAHILRNSLMKRLMTDPNINPTYLARLIANPVDQRYDATINSLVDNRTDCFDEYLMRIQRIFVRFFRDVSAKKKDCYEKYCEMLLEKLFNNGTHIHGIDIYQAFLVVFAIGRDRLLVNDIERVELLITWTGRFFENYTIDEWIEEKGGWEKLAAKPFIPPPPRVVDFSAKEMKEVGIWPRGDYWEFAFGVNDDPPHKRVTSLPDEDSDGNLSMSQETDMPQQNPFYGANLQQPHVTNPQLPYMVNPAQPYVVNVQQPYMINPQYPGMMFAASQPYMAYPQQPNFVNPQQPYLVNPQLPYMGNPPNPYVVNPRQPSLVNPQLPYMDNPPNPYVVNPRQPSLVNPQLPYMGNPPNPYVVNPYQPFMGNPQQPYTVDSQPPYLVGNPESNVIAQEEVFSLEGERMFHQFDETMTNLFGNSVPQNFPPPEPQRLFPRPQRSSPPSQIPESFSTPDHTYHYGPAQANSAARLQSTTQEMELEEYSP